MCIRDSIYRDASTLIEFFTVMMIFHYKQLLSVSRTAAPFPFFCTIPGNFLETNSPESDVKNFSFFFFKLSQKRFLNHFRYFFVATLISICLATWAFSITLYFSRSWEGGDWNPERLVKNHSEKEAYSHSRMLIRTLEKKRNHQRSINCAMTPQNCTN